MIAGIGLTITFVLIVIFHKEIIKFISGTPDDF